MSNVGTKAVKAAPVYSSHIFIFPFEWKRKGSENKLLEDQADLNFLHQYMHKTSADWERRDSWFPPSSIPNYNEANYFYEFVRPVLYDTGKEDTLQCHYYLKLSEQTQYVIQLEDKGNTTYSLEVDDIILSFYSTGIGVMAFHLLNRSYPKPEAILEINEFGRRLFPAAYGSNTDLIGQQSFFEYRDWSNGLSGTKTYMGLLAKSISIVHTSRQYAYEDFKQWQKTPQLDVLPGLIQQLLSQAFMEQFSLSPLLDDRMFVVCWYGNDQLVQELKPLKAQDEKSQTAKVELREEESKKKKDQAAYLSHDWWYKFVFVDVLYKSCANDQMVTEQLQKHTYARWLGLGAFYGVSRYSMVCLTETMESESFAKVICSQMQTMYYKLALLCLVQRACMLRFSQEVTTISQLPKRDRKIGERVGSLYKQYIRFINKIYFREVTAQEQGIELYDLLQTHMRLDTHVKELEGEIRELHNYVLILEENERSEKLDVLTYIGAFFVVPSFFVSYFGLNGFDDKPEWSYVALISLVAAILAYLVIRGTGTWRIVFILLFIFFLAFSLWFYPQNILKL